MSVSRAIAACFLLLTAAASSPQRYDWGAERLDPFNFGTDAVAEADSTQKVCRAESAAEPPAADQPSSSDRVQLKDCNSEALYYGIGVAADPVAARKCALIEREGEVGPNAPQFAGLGYSYFSGTGILAMIYANGSGTPRNLDVAIHMACGVEDAPAASEGRIQALLDRKAGKGESGPFEICDNATSGISEGYCADHLNRIEEQTRKRRIEVLGATWSEPLRRAFDRVYASFSRYAETAHEMDCFGGTAHAACAIAGASADQTDFLRRIEALAAGHRPQRRLLQEGESPSPALAPLDPSGVPQEQRALYRSTYDATVAARAAFEKDLVAHMRRAFPTWSTHDVRVMFRDL